MSMWQATWRMLPPFVGLCTVLIKDTSLAAIYFLICFPLTQFSQRAEARLQRP